MLYRIGICATLFLAASAWALADDKKETPKVEEGKPAPAFDLPATQIEKVLPDKKDAKTISLKDFEGKKNVVLFFYPKAMTKGCTIESCGFSKSAADFAKVDTILLGISVDKLDDQMKFTEKETLTIPLLADPEKKITAAYGALGTNGYASRYTYVIDKKGIVRKIYNKVDPEKHPEEVLKYIQENLAK
jgi:peroxiredoxin Q/BCP